MSIYRLLITMSLCTCISSNYSAYAQGSAADLVDQPGLEGVSVGMLAFDMLTGDVLDAYDSDRLLCPASVWKIATTAAALEILGPDFRFSTELNALGTMKGRTLQGDLIIVGGGDPSLGSRQIGAGFTALLEDWLDAVKRAGIDTIAGSVIGNSAHFQGDGLPPTRIWEDMGNYYGAAVSGLNIHDNTYFIKFRVADEPGLTATIAEVYPVVPKLEVQSEVVGSTHGGDHAFIFGSPMDTNRIVRGTLPAGSREFEIKGSLPDPALFAAFQLREYLTKNGIVVTGAYLAEPDLVREPVTSRVIDRHLSPPLSELVKHTNTRSDNLFAETFVLQIGVQSGNPTLEGGMQALRLYYKDICNPNTFFFAYDGSGLSRFTSVSATHLMQILMHCRQNPVLKTHLLEALPQAGKEGTMTYFGRNTNLHGNLRGKSGSMEGVKSYTGYFTAYSGREIGFVALFNNFQIGPVEVRKKIEKWLLGLYGNY